MVKNEVLKIALERLEYWYDYADCLDDGKAITAIKESLAQRTWSGLTDEEVNKLVDDEDWYNFPHEFAKAVEAKLRSKNT